jgi:putative transposase
MKASATQMERGEQMALFRAMVIGEMATQQLMHGELTSQLRALAQKRFRPPGAVRTRRFGVSTLERWYYRYRRSGLKALRPERRRDAGRARRISAAERDLLLAIRAEYPHASVPLILRTLCVAGVLAPGAVSAPTVRRLYREAGLPRCPRPQANAEIDEVRQRLRWRSAHVNSLWHADVCHALRLKPTTDATTPALVHALLDDHSRYIVRLEVRATEREQDMLEILANAVRENGAPDRLYTDGGATYTGGLLPIVCERMGTHLLHPRPRDPQARGKGERLFRTMREQCIDHIHGAASLHDVFVRLLAWREQYHDTPHAGLMGRTPKQLWREGTQSIEHQRRRRLTQEELEEAYVMRTQRQVRKDSTLSIDGKTFEVDAGWLAGKEVTLVRSSLNMGRLHVEFEGRRFPLGECEPLRNANRRRKPSKKRCIQAPSTDFRPADVALDAMMGRDSKEKKI